MQLNAFFSFLLLYFLSIESDTQELKQVSDGDDTTPEVAIKDRDASLITGRAVDDFFFSQMLQPAPVEENNVYGPQQFPYYPQQQPTYSQLIPPLLTNYPNPYQAYSPYYPQNGGTYQNNNPFSWMLQFQRPFGPMHLKLYDILHAGGRAKK